MGLQRVVPASGLTLRLLLVPHSAIRTHFSQQRAHLAVIIGFPARPFPPPPCNDIFLLQLPSQFLQSCIRFCNHSQSLQTKIFIHSVVLHKTRDKSPFAFLFIGLDVDCLLHRNSTCPCSYYYLGLDGIGEIPGGNCTCSGCVASLSTDSPFAACVAPRSCCCSSRNETA